MPSAADKFIASLPEERRKPMMELRGSINKNLPKGFEETVSRGMINWVVPHEIYPAGYHCDPEQALPFLSLASQKNNISLYHMGLYGDPDLLKWFQEEWSKASNRKLDMGKSCIRLKNLDEIPFELIGRLATKMSPADWVIRYEAVLKR